MGEEKSDFSLDVSEQERDELLLEDDGLTADQEDNPTKVFSNAYVNSPGSVSNSSASFQGNAPNTPSTNATGKIFELPELKLPALDWDDAAALLAKRASESKHKSLIDDGSNENVLSSPSGGATQTGNTTAPNSQHFTCSAETLKLPSKVSFRGYFVSILHLYGKLMDISKNFK